MKIKEYLYNKIIDYIRKKYTKNSENDNNIKNKNNELLNFLKNKNFRNDQNYIFGNKKKKFLLNYLFDDYKNLNKGVLNSGYFIDGGNTLLIGRLNNLRGFKKNFSFKFFFRKIFWIFFILFLILVFRSFSGKFEDIFAIIIFLPIFFFIVGVYFSTNQNKYKKYQKIFMIDKNNFFYLIKK